MSKPFVASCGPEPTPSYAHLPVATNAGGEKLSKQTQAAALNPLHGSAALAEVLNFLGHPVPPELRTAPLAEFWCWAVSAWSIDKVPAVRGIFPGSFPDTLAAQCLPP